MTKFRRIDPEISRRTFVNYSLGVAAGVSALSFITIVGSARPVSRQTPDKLPPAEGDILVYAEGTNTGKPVDIGTLEPNPTRAYPQRKTKSGETILKKGEQDSNLVLISKFPEGQLKAPTNLQAAPQGIVVYGAVCQHLGCQVNWKNQDQTYLCPCHSGNYDPKAGCKVIGGPPPRPLPQLPVRVEGTQLVVTGTYLIPPYGVSEEEYEQYKQLAEEATKA
ncbi:ubiquinol-cytochrome c reductase iron-sulfur subunit [Deinococcus pimensis]|uniref:ubiquinol-cytochrome c reductase iron-sulfur subunit n=1 Tax=Deinococcus pimensis TaxID=309888 RepID=UPI00048279B1|nr:Rieske 2Fe-2S domain-containing protein [Deinococcus pimensis]